MSPRGAPFTQARAREWAAGPGLVILCPRFEGVDERLIGARGLTEVSIGDYVLSGGEIAALAVLDACVRLIPGVMGKEASGEDESFENGLLEYPQYTRPREWEGRAIPEVLLSGDHARIAEWRRREAERITRERRPDLGDEQPILSEFLHVIRSAEQGNASEFRWLREFLHVIRSAGDGNASEFRSLGSISASAPGARRGSRRSRAGSCGRASRPRRISPRAGRDGISNPRAPHAAPA